MLQCGVNIALTMVSARTIEALILHGRTATLNVGAPVH